MKIVIASMLAVSVFSFSFQITLNAQTSRLSVSKAVFLIGKSETVVRSSLTALNYSYKGTQEGFEQYEKPKELGYSQLTTYFKNHKLDDIAWSESLLFSSKIMSDSMFINDFILDENSISSLLIYRNKSKNLILTLIDHSDEGYIYITLGKDINNNSQTNHDLIIINREEYEN